VGGEGGDRGLKVGLLTNDEICISGTCCICIGIEGSASCKARSVRQDALYASYPSSTCPGGFLEWSDSILEYFRTYE